MNRNLLELIVSLVLIGVSAASLMTIGMAEDSASPFLLAQERSLGGIDYSSFPRLYAIVLIILCGLNVALLIKKRGWTTQQDASQEKRRRIVWLTLATGVLTLVYTLLLPYINFVVVTAVFLFVMFRLYGRTNLLKNSTVAVAGSVLFWVVFVYLSHLTI
ncbi:MAG: tripartite tricarboxylate transporter TctB family protein [Mailhella sp.]|nr:tripartite tricarboxylate transporter TctB family protein [Mailhella sp.]